MGVEPARGVIRAGATAVVPTDADADQPGAGAVDVTSSPLDPSVGPTGSLRWTTAVAFGIVVVPFAVAIVRLIEAPGIHIYLPDDLALIDLHTRRALVWKQQLGVFDHNGWNHPGPAYFYLLSVAYRLLGDGARALFVGSTSINLLAAVSCLAVVRHRSTATRTLWAAVAMTPLLWLLADASPGSITYSEGALGGLVSPWNPMVVIIPLLLVILLGAAAVDRSALSLVACVGVASFVVQTDISTLPLVLAVVIAAAVGWIATSVADRRGPRTVQRAMSPDRRRRGVGWMVLMVASGAAIILMWIPPLVEQLSGHPGNMTLIVRFFTADHPRHSLESGIRAVVAVYGVAIHGTSEVMTSALGSRLRHGWTDIAVSLAVVALGLLVVVMGARQRNRFAAALGTLLLVGTATAIGAAASVVGVVFGYLLLWAVVLPVGAAMGVGLLQLPGRWTSGGRVALIAPARMRSGRIVLAVAGSVACLCTVIRVASIPPLTTVSDTQVSDLVHLVVPALDRDQRVLVGDQGAGSGANKLLDAERFIGLVNALDQSGYRPSVNQFWRAQFGPGYLSDGRERQTVVITTWGAGSPSTTGYLGRVGDMAVTLSRDPPKGVAG